MTRAFKMTLLHDYESLQCILTQTALFNVSDAVPDFFNVGMAKNVIQVDESRDLTSIFTSWHT